MRGGAFLAGLRDYLISLVVVALPPFAWVRALRTAGRHRATDPRAVAKVVAAIVVGSLLLAGALYAVVSFHAQSTANIGDDPEAQQGLDSFLIWFVYPGLVGLLYAPLVWAVGSSVRSAWEPSASVGFKPYPHFVAGLFLFLGAFGVPALFFAAWVLQDLRTRSLEGQITL